jgi:hypothetical protein
VNAPRMSPIPLPPELRDRVLAVVEREPVPTRAAGARRRVRALVLGFGSMLATLAVLGVRPHGRPRGYLTALGLAWLSIAAAATWAGVAQGRSMLGRPARWLVAVVMLTPIALMATCAAVAVCFPSLLQDASGPKQHLVCDVATLSSSVGPLLAFIALRRGTDPVTPRLTAAAIGTAAAAWAAIALHLVCGFTAPVHIAVGHLAPVFVVAVASAILFGHRVGVRR